MTKPFSDNVLGVILAGGRSRRMGSSDKALLPWERATLLEQVIARAQPQVDRLIISSNSASEEIANLGLKVIKDTIPDYPGPLAGIIGAMEWALNEPGKHQWLATFATDTPFVPQSFVPQCLQQAINEGVDVVHAQNAGRDHYVMAVWRISMLPHLQEQFAGGVRALKVIMANCRAQASEFTGDDVDPFFNINTPDDWLWVQRYWHHGEE